MERSQGVANARRGLHKAYQAPLGVQKMPSAHAHLHPNPGKSNLALGLGFPRTQTGPRIPFPGKEGFGVQKHPFPLGLEMPGKGLSVKIPPFSLCSLVEKKKRIF